MAGEVLVDALPYIDLGYDDPGVREAVSSENEINRSIVGMTGRRRLFILLRQCCQLKIIVAVH